jgi:predicted O-methyltransferase YrrM
MLLDYLKNASCVCRHPDHLAGMFLYDLVHLYGLRSALEIGAFHKATFLYIATAFEERQDGQLVAIDNDIAPDCVAALTQAATMLQLDARLALELSPVSQHWKMFRLLQEGAAASFDCCFLAGRQTWLHAGFAAALALKLLKPGGWLVLADAEYSYALDPSAPSDIIPAMSDAELQACQVDLVYEHFLARDTSLGNHLRAGRLLAAQKLSEEAGYSERHGKKAMAQSHIIHKALKRSAFDPDFRRWLLNSPPEAMVALASQLESTHESEVHDFSGVYFHDRERNPVLLSKSQHREIHLILPDPVWQATISEAELERLVERAQRRHTQSS